MRVLLADDHTLFRRVLAGLLAEMADVTVVGEARDGQEAVLAAEQLRPDLVLMDVRMPSCNGIEATRRIKQGLPQVRVVALTISEDLGDLLQIVQNGASGYLLKNATPEELAEGLRQAMRGETVLSAPMASRVFQVAARSPESPEVSTRAGVLSPREQEVLRLVAEGATNKEVSSRLAVSESTVRNHLYHVLRKLHARNRVQAALAIEGRCPAPGQGAPTGGPA